MTGMADMSIGKSPENRASEFWGWFSEQRGTIERLLNRSEVNALSELVGPKVSELSSRLGWEIGPGLNQEYAFSFSLNGETSNVLVAEEILSHAPLLENWEYHAGRPKKNWDFTFWMTNQQKQRVFIDASSWEYYLTSFGADAFFDITLIAHDPPRLDEAAKLQAANVVVLGCLGERQALERISRANLVARADESIGDALTSIKYLDDHIHMICKNKLA
jgi:hypothetical protein